MSPAYSAEKARLVANRAYLVRTAMRLVHEEDGRQLLANAQWMLHRVWSSIQLDAHIATTNYLF